MQLSLPGKRYEKLPNSPIRFAGNILDPQHLERPTSACRLSATSTSTDRGITDVRDRQHSLKSDTGPPCDMICASPRASRPQIDSSNPMSGRMTPAPGQLAHIIISIAKFAIAAPPWRAPPTALGPLGVSATGPGVLARFQQAISPERRWPRRRAWVVAGGQAEFAVTNS